MVPNLNQYSICLSRYLLLLPDVEFRQPRLQLLHPLQEGHPERPAASLRLAEVRVANVAALPDERRVVIIVVVDVVDVVDVVVLLVLIILGRQVFVFEYHSVAYHFSVAADLQRYYASLVS